MSEIIGVDVMVKIGEGSTVAILGQRNASLNSTREKIDKTTKDKWPNKSYLYGWIDGNIDCDGLLNVGTAGFADLVLLQYNGTIVDVAFTIGDTGEEFTGKALLTDLKCDAPQDKEGTFTCKLEKTDAWTPVVGA